MQPEPRRDEPLVASVATDEDQTAWLLTFSDLVLQLFAFVLVSSVLGAAHHASARARVEEPPQAVASVEAGEPYAPPAGEESLSAPAEETLSVPGETGLAASGAREAAARDASLAREAVPVVAAEPQAIAVPLPPAAAPLVASEAPLVPSLAPLAADPGAVAPGDVASPVLARRLASIGGYLEAFARAQSKGDAVRVTVGESDLVLSLRDTIGFPSGSAELLPAARPILAELRSIVRELPDFGIDVTGHTDDVPIHSALYPSNLELSLARAARVARELSAGMPSLRIRTSAEGFGENRPVASNDDAQGRAQNRRVEIRLVKLG